MWAWSEHHAEHAAAASWTTWRTGTPKPTVTDPQPWTEPQRTEPARTEGHGARRAGEPGGRRAVGRESNSHRAPARPAGNAPERRNGLERKGASETRPGAAATEPAVGSPADGVERRADVRSATAALATAGESPRAVAKAASACATRTAGAVAVDASPVFGPRFAPATRCGERVVLGRALPSRSG